MNTARKVVRRFKDTFSGYTELELLVRAATSNDKKMTARTKLVRIAQQSYSVSGVTEIFSVLDKRLNDTGHNWRHVLKSLTVVEFCLLFGSTLFVSASLSRVLQFRTLKDFQYVSKSKKDRGSLIRDKSRYIYTLLTTDELAKLREEGRKRLKEMNCPLREDEVVPSLSTSPNSLPLSREPPLRPPRTEKEMPLLDENEKAIRQLLSETGQSVSKSSSCVGNQPDLDALADDLLFYHDTPENTSEETEETEDALSLGSTTVPSLEPASPELQASQETDFQPLLEEENFTFSRHSRTAKPASFRQFK